MTSHSLLMRKAIRPALGLLASILISHGPSYGQEFPPSEPAPVLIARIVPLDAAATSKALLEAADEQSWQVFAEAWKKAGKGTGESDGYQEAQAVYSILPVSSMNLIRSYAIQDGPHRLTVMADMGTLSTFYAWKLSIGTTGYQSGVMNREQKPLNFDPYVTDDEGNLARDWVLTLVTAEAKRIVEGPKNGDLGTDNSYFTFGTTITPITDTVSFCAGFASEVFSDLEISHQGKGYKVTIADMTIDLSTDEFKEIMKLAFNGTSNPETAVEEGKDHPWQTDAVEKFGRGKVVAAGAVFARQNEEGFAVSYSGSIPQFKEE